MSFRGTRRFELIRKLGEGGMGVVYEAHDNERQMRVALKTLRDLDASSLYRFKREFRALTDISHPNIIGFYELVSEGNDWFFTMELVDGIDFVRWVRPAGWFSSSELAAMETAGDTAVIAQRREALASAPPEPVVNDVRPQLVSLVQIDRLRGVARQLAEALFTLHGAGMVHRDLKPSNVVVTSNGRAVLMDFGIAAEASVRAELEGGVAGTPAFMAPEQAAGDPPTAAADWYSFGVMLYLSLAGRLPYLGQPEQMLLSKQAAPPPPPSQLVDGVPPELESLCLRLLSHDPSLRPSGEEVLARLGVVSSELRTESPESSRAAFVGREPELAELRAAFAAARAGRTVGAFVRGSSGMGKSTLVRRFLHELELDPDLPIVLKGRCHERESLPYKAFDGVIDSLSHVLLRLPAERTQSLLPEEVDLLPRLFPVLRRVPGIQRARPLGVSNPQEVRSRAFAALSELLRRLARFRPLVIYIDDLQWADRDSLQLLVELLRDPDAPHALFLAAMRAENLATEPALAEALRAVATRHEVHELDLGPLSPDEQRTLVGRMLGEAATPEQVSDAFWGESAGSPLFLSELVRYAREHGGALPDGERPTLEDVLYSRIARLPAPARALLEVVAIAGEPVPLWILGDAAALSAEDRERALAMLRVTSLVRVARHGREPWLAAYHDRVRETLAARLAGTPAMTLHRRLVEVLERWDEVTVDALARHWLAAGDRAQAGAYLVKAARGAAEKLAFERAAELYRVALDSMERPPEERLQLVRERADTLALAGRCYEAAQLYHEAARDADPDDAVELRRRAGDNLLRSGHVVEGLATMREVMRALGIKVAPTRRRAIASLLLARVRIAVRGLGYKRRDAAEVPARALARLDSLYAVSTALGMIDHIRGADVQTRHLLSALDAGEERAVVRALAIEAVFRASFGGSQMRDAEEISRDVELKARRLGDPQLVGWAHMANGATAVFSGRYRAAASAFSEGQRIFQDIIGAGWERNTARFFYLTARNILGDWNESSRVTTRYIEEAERRNDLYARALFKTQPNAWRCLRDDDPDTALRDLDTVLEGWPPDTFYTAHFLELVTRVIVLMYRGDTREALALIKRKLPDVKRSQLARLPWVMTDLWRHLLRAAFSEGDLGELERTLKKIASLKAPATDAFVALYRGALACRAGARDEAEQQMVRALHLYEEVEMSQMAAAARFRLGKLIGGTDGARMSDEALAWLGGQGCKAPMKMIDLLAPSLA
jgi:serine/threonine protein kinase/tetratricopeptide (TPR) repeat protein